MCSKYKYSPDAHICILCIVFDMEGEYNGVVAGVAFCDMWRGSVARFQAWRDGASDRVETHALMAVIMKEIQEPRWWRTQIVRC